MTNKYILLAAVSALLISSCKNKFESDASGMFESEEIIVSAQQTGQLLNFNVNEGDNITKNTIIGHIDVTGDKLKVQQVEASITALSEKTNNPQEQVAFYKKQIEVQQAQLSQLTKEKNRIENLLKADAATKKQLDDINASIDQMQKQINVTQQQIQLSLSNISTQNRSIMSEKNPLEKSVEQIQYQISKGDIVCPITGTVLTKYAYEGEMTASGKALFKIANLDTLTLRAYISGDQLGQIKNGQVVKVLTDNGKKDYKEYTGTISWISSKAEFTPKTIQTKDERANLVYAIKVRVKNDGFLKIGMYGEVRLK
jgi:HlyD family secretion protein